MKRRILRPAAFSVLVLLISACATGHVRTGDRLAKEGKWEEALAAYRTAKKESATNRVFKRIERAEIAIAEGYVRKGVEAAKADAMPEAAEWWKQASELRPNDRKPGSARVVIAEHAAKLEACGQASMKAKKWENAFRCYEALQIAYPDRFDLSEKIEKAHKQFAAQLDENAQKLADKGLTGAALVVSMRSRAHDPLQADAFERESRYRKELAATSLIDVDGVTLDDRGFWGLGAYLKPALTRRLGEYPPYGPTKNPKAQAAVFVVTVEDFGWWDDVSHGVTKKAVENAKPAEGEEKVANPEHAVQKALVVTLEREVKAMETAAAPEPTPEPEEDGGDAKGKKRKKSSKSAKKTTKAKDAGDDAKLAPPPRTPTQEQIAKKRTALEAAKAKLAELPETVTPAEAAAHRFVPWTDVTRIVEARVRFEVREADFSEPVVKTLTLQVEAKDRTHGGSAEHGEEADKLEVASVEELVAQLAEKLAGPGTETLAEARARRADRWIERGRAARTAGSEDEALDLYVRALFARGVEGGELPGDAATVLAVRLEKASVQDIVAGP